MAIPNSEAALPGYVANFAAKLVAAPTVYATTAPAATAFELLANDYQAAQVALVAAREAGVRSEPLRDARDAAKAAMLPTLRSFYGTIQKNINISAQAKTEIGVKNPKTTVSTVLAPTLRPNTTVTAVFDRTVSMVIEDPTVGVRRSRPKGATQTLVYYFAGENYSSDPNTWQFAGVSTERKYSFTVPGTVAAGTRVWVCAAYTNQRGDSGPVSVPGVRDSHRFAFHRLCISPRFVVGPSRSHRRRNGRDDRCYSMQISFAGWPVFGPPHRPRMTSDTAARLNRRTNAG